MQIFAYVGKWIIFAGKENYEKNFSGCVGSGNDPNTDPVR